MHNIFVTECDLSEWALIRSQILKFYTMQCVKFCIYLNIPSVAQVLALVCANQPNHYYQVASMKFLISATRQKCMTGCVCARSSIKVMMEMKKNFFHQFLQF